MYLYAVLLHTPITKIHFLETYINYSYICIYHRNCYMSMAATFLKSEVLLFGSKYSKSSDTYNYILDFQIGC